MPFVSRTRATFRSAEFGFFGVVVYTRVHTPRFCGAPRSAGVFVFALGVLRPFRTSWLTVGTSLLREDWAQQEAGADELPPTRTRHGSERSAHPQSAGPSHLDPSNEVPHARGRHALKVLLE